MALSKRSHLTYAIRVKSDKICSHLIVLIFGHVAKEDDERCQEGSR